MRSPSPQVEQPCGCKLGPVFDYCRTATDLLTRKRSRYLDTIVKPFDQRAARRYRVACEAVDVHFRTPDENGPAGANRRGLKVTGTEERHPPTGHRKEGTAPARDPQPLEGP